MNTVTIPKKLTGGEELVVIPRREYEEFSQWRKAVKYFIPNAAQARDLKKAREDYKNGKYFTINEFKHKLGIKN